MNVFDRPPCYRTYLLTCWGEQSQDPSEPVVWRFRVEDPHTGRRRGFASLEALVAAVGGCCMRWEKLGDDPSAIGKAIKAAAQPNSSTK